MISFFFDLELNQKITYIDIEWQKILEMYKVKSNS
jgi:hypothetical protein